MLFGGAGGRKLEKLGICLLFLVCPCKAAIISLTNANDFSLVFHWRTDTKQVAFAIQVKTCFSRSFVAWRGVAVDY